MKNAYKKFAYYYDEIMQGMNYDLWLEFVEPYLKKEDKILDLACGTGTFATMLKLKGFDVEASDLSEEIIEIANEMYIVNIRSANERIIYESIKETYYNDEEKDSQVLLLPDIITLSSKEMFTAKQNEYMLNNAGFEFEEFGANTVKLVGVPAICEKLNTKQLFIEILDGLETVAITETKEKEEKFISTIACKSAEKSKVNLDEKEIDELIQKILSFDNPFTYPYGSQVAIKMTRYDLEKKFSRR